MSRRASSFSSPKISISPPKTNSKPPSKKNLNLSETKHLLNKVPSPPISKSLISNLCQKLKEKHSSIVQGLKKLSDQYNNEISVIQFRNILHDLKIKYTEKEFKDFFRIYGKTQKSSNFIGITIESLTKCIQASISPQKKPASNFKKDALMKTLNFSTKSSTKVLQDLNFSLHSQCDRSLGLKKSDREVFFEHLLEIFYCPENVVEYFFVDREEFVEFEEFFESVQCLGLEKEYLDFKSMFLQLSNSGKISKNDFFCKIFEFGCRDKVVNRDLEEFRLRLQKAFIGSFAAFQEISDGDSLLNPAKVEKAALLIGMEKEKDEIVELLSQDFPDCCMNFKDFKKFWLGKEGVCAIKCCEENVFESFSYCKTHIQCLANRGEEIYTKLQLVMKRTQLQSLIQEILKSEKSKLFIVNGFELQKKDSQALKEFLKLHGINIRPASSSIKTRIKHN